MHFTPSLTCLYISRSFCSGILFVKDDSRGNILIFKILPLKYSLPLLPFPESAGALRSEAWCENVMQVTSFPTVYFGKCRTFLKILVNQFLPLCCPLFLTPLFLCKIPSEAPPPLQYQIVTKKPENSTTSNVKISRINISHLVPSTWDDRHHYQSYRLRKGHLILAHDHQIFNWRPCLAI